MRGVLFLTEAGFDGMPDSFAVIKFCLGHSGVEGDSFSDEGPGELWGGELFIGEGMEDFGGVEGVFIVEFEYVSEEKSEHLMV